MSSSSMQSTQQHTFLKDIRPMMRKLDIKVIVLQQEGEPVILRDGCIIKFMVADTTGVMLLNVWGSSGEAIRSGDILRITEVESKYRSGQHYIATSRRGKIQRIGQDTFPFAEGPNFSEQEPGANIPPSRAVRTAVAAGQATGSGINQSPSSKQQQQQPYANSGLPVTGGLSISSSKPSYTNNGQSTAMGTTRQAYTNNGLQPSAGTHQYWSHRNHGDGWRGDGGKGRIMGRKGGNDDQRRPGLSGIEGTAAANLRDPRKRNLDNSSTSAGAMSNDDSRSTRQKISYNEFTP